MRFVILAVIALLGLAVWDSVMNDGQWGRAAGQAVESRIDDVLQRIHSL